MKLLTDKILDQILVKYNDRINNQIYPGIRYKICMQIEHRVVYNVLYKVQDYLRKSLK